MSASIEVAIDTAAPAAGRIEASATSDSGTRETHQRACQQHQQAGGRDPVADVEHRPPPLAAARAIASPNSSGTAIDNHSARRLSPRPMSWTSPI